VTNRRVPGDFRLRLLTAALALTGLIGPWCAAISAGTYTSAVATITRQGLRRHCLFLASDALEGRETGTQGGQAAGAYIVAQLRKQKLSPAGPNGDYYQPFAGTGNGTSNNIVCRLPGSDPELAKECVIVCAHYDHVGRGNSRNSRGPTGYIHHGADDNASGTSALLELISAFTSLDTAPKRSLVFIFWDAEEAGLLGSEYWVQYPTIPLNDVRLVFNLDMVGRLRENRAEVFGARTAAGLRELIAANNHDPSILMTFSWDTRRDSDHYPFYAHQIPFLMVFTGKHAEYHTPYDDVEKLNVDGMERVTRLLFRTAYAAAQAPRLPAFRPAAFQDGSARQESTELPADVPPPRLGVTWDEGRAREHVIEIVQVDPGSPAEAAGIQLGDQVVKFDRAPIHNAAEMREAVLAAPDDTSAVIVHRGQTAPRTLAVHLLVPAHPSGIICRTDDADPDCVIVGRVLAGSAAERAGLRLNDHIYKVSGKPVSSLPQITTLLSRGSGRQSVEIERDGEVRTLEVMLPQRDAGKDLPASPR
jgi:hypothetical protein